MAAVKESGSDYARPRGLQAQRRHCAAQLAQPGVLGKASSHAFLAIPARGHQIWRVARAGDVPRAPRGSGAAARPREDPARTRDWLRYEVPEHYIRKDARGHYRGQKQIWFLLKLLGRDSDMNLRATDHPEFDAWRWNDYWVPLDVVIEFKRGVYQLALTELARFLPKTNYHNRYLRGGPRGPRDDHDRRATCRRTPWTRRRRVDPHPGVGDDPTPEPPTLARAAPTLAREARRRPSSAGGDLGWRARAKSRTVAVGVGVLHRELAPAHDAEARTALVAELGLDLVEVLRQLLVAAQLLARDVGDRLLGGGLQHEVAVVAILHAQQFRAHLPEAARSRSKARPAGRKASSARRRRHGSSPRGRWPRPCG